MFLECREGWYGVNCSHQCSEQCRNSNICNYVTGQCDEGCDAGWTETLCKQGKYVYLFFFLFCNVFCWFCFYGLLQIRIDIIDIFVKWNQIILLVQGIGNKIIIFFYNSINWKTNMYKSNNHISLHKNGHSLLVTRRSW